MSLNVYVEYLQQKTPIFHSVFRREKKKIKKLQK